MIDSLGSKIQIHRIGPLKIGKIDFSRKPLEQEPCGKDINVPATDAISRHAVLDVLGECPMVWTDSDAEIASERDWKDTVEMLKRLPSVTPQESVLDKIRAEIEQITDTMGVSYNQYVSKIDVLQVIDKYKAESEEKK